MAHASGPVGSGDWTGPQRGHAQQGLLVRPPRPEADLPNFAYESKAEMIALRRSEPSTRQRGKGSLNPLDRSRQSPVVSAPLTTKHLRRADENTVIGAI